MRHRKEEDDLYRKFQRQREEEEKRIRDEIRVSIDKYLENQSLFQLPNLQQLVCPILQEKRSHYSVFFSFVLRKEFLNIFL